MTKKLEFTLIVTVPADAHVREVRRNLENVLDRYHSIAGIDSARLIRRNTRSAPRFQLAADVKAG